MAEARAAAARQKLKDAAGLGQVSVGIQPVGGGAAGDLMHKIVKGYRLCKELGHGSFSHVYLAQHQQRGQTVAIKEIRLSDTERWSSWTLREISILQQLRHANIVQMLDFGVLPKRVFIVCEAAEKDLRRFLNRRTSIDQTLNRHYLRQIFSAVAFCHEREIVHRDLKPENVLLFPNNIVKVADFGLAKVLSLRTQVSTPGCATLWYRPPEILLNNPRHSVAIDAWSLGCMVAEMVTGQVTFSAENEATQIGLIVERLGRPTVAQLTSMRGMPCTASSPAAQGELEDVDQGVPIVLPKTAQSAAEQQESRDTRAAFLQQWFAPTPKAGKLVSQMLAYAPEQRVLPSAALTTSLYFANSSISGASGRGSSTGGSSSKTTAAGR